MNNYSSSKCPKCEKTLFELAEDVPTNSKYKFQYLRCSSCHTLITVLPFIHTNTMLQAIEEKIDTIVSKLKH